MFLAICLVGAGYLLGSVSSAVLVCRWLGLGDPRTAGSGNPGATNVLRVGGKKAAVLTLVGDVLKGVIPVLAAHLVSGQPAIVAATALAAFLGHLYPIFFGFKGGKGVATAVGVIAAMAWKVAAAMILTWILIALVFRYSSLSALTAALLAPAYTALLAPDNSYVAAVATMSLFLFWRHRSNIRKLIAGTEDKIGGRSQNA